MTDKEKLKAITNKIAELQEREWSRYTDAEKNHERSIVFLGRGLLIEEFIDFLDQLPQSKTTLSELHAPSIIHDEPKIKKDYTIPETLIKRGKIPK